MLRSAVLAATCAAASAEWQVIASDVGTISTGSVFTDANTGYLPVSQNGVGTSILKSTDGGATWTDNAQEPFALLLLDITAHGSNVAVVGALTLEYSLDAGATYNTSLGPLGAGQCIRNIGVEGKENGFAAVGQWGLVKENNGPAVSFDLGITYSAINASSLVADARYGAFPSDQVFFISAGDWPGEGADDQPTCDNPPCGSRRKMEGSVVNPLNYMNAVAEGSVLVKRQGARAHLLREPSGSLVWALVKGGRLAEANLGASSGAINDWEAQIARSTDGGKTWQTVFSQFGQFYFNGIECSSTEDCCAVAEAQDANSTAGTYIWCTSDGGDTWADAFRDTDQQSSLIDIAAVSPQEYWAVGGEFGALGIKNPSFYTTTDAGKSWTAGTYNLSTLIFNYAIAIDCAGGNCWANTLDVLTQESSLAVLNS